MYIFIFHSYKALKLFHQCLECSQPQCWYCENAKPINNELSCTLLNSNLPAECVPVDSAYAIISSSSLLTAICGCKLMSLPVSASNAMVLGHRC